MERLFAALIVATPLLASSVMCPLLRHVGGTS
jgi:hypothetical protein